MENIKGKKSILSIRFSQIILCFGIFVITFLGLRILTETIWKGILVIILIIPFVIMIILFELYLYNFIIMDVEFTNDKIKLFYKNRILELEMNNIEKREESIIQGVKGYRYITNSDDRFLLLEKKGHLLTQYFDDNISYLMNKKYKNCKYK